MRKVLLLAVFLFLLTILVFRRPVKALEAEFEKWRTCNIMCAQVMPRDDYCPRGEIAFRPGDICGCGYYCSRLCNTDAECPLGERCEAIYTTAPYDGYHGRCSGYHPPFAGLTLTAGQEYFLNMFDNKAVSTMDNNTGKIAVTYQTVGTGNAVLQRKNYWSTGTIASSTSFTLPASAGLVTTTLGTIPNNGWTGPGAVTLKIKNAGTNTIQISSLTVYGAFGVVMGTYPPPVCGGTVCTEGKICYQGTVCAPGCSTDLNCPSGYRCDVTACVPKPACPRSKGDANCKDGITTADYDIWKCEYQGNNTCAVTGSDKSADFNDDKRVDLIDFEIWRNTYYNSN